MRRLLPLALTAFAATHGPAIAVEIDVQDFAGMTRIVVAMPPSGWSVTTVAQGIELNAGQSEPGVSAPALESGSRLTRLDVWRGDSASGIGIGFGCDCVSAHYTDGGNLVIDVTERSRIPAIEPASAIVSPRRGWSNVTIDTGTAPAAPDADYEEAWRLANVLVATPPPRRRPERTARRVVESGDQAIDELRDSVLNSLALGVEQGRITMDTGPSRRRIDYIPAGCPDEDALDLGRLTTPGNFRGPIPVLRAAVFDDLKQIDPEAVRALARHFLAYGLGEEARSVLDAFDMADPKARMIRTMAAVLEGRTAELGNPLLLKPGCGPRAAVWRAAVAAENGTGAVGEAYADAASALFHVPGPLRKIIGARIALGLLEEDDREAAMRVWRDLEGADGPATPEMRLLAAWIDADDPLPSLVAFAEGRSPLAPEAAIMAAGLLLDRHDETMAERLVPTLEDIGFLRQGTPDEMTLRLALARIQARYGNLASALTILEEKVRTNPERAAHWRSIAYDTIRTASESADPVSHPADFEIILTTLGHLDGSERSDAARLSLARTLMESGGTHLVGGILTSDVLDRSDAARRLMAEAKLRDGDAAGAQALLGSLKDTDSDGLREKARRMSGVSAQETALVRFGPSLSVPAIASLSGARALLEETETDLSIAEELLNDG